MSDQSRKDVVFFRHLPKTAGTSLTTTLANIYGDAQTYRFRDVGEDFAALFSSVLQARGDVLSLVSGHIPLLSVPEGACGTEFTILRDPIARVLSLRRFLEQQPAGHRARMGLGDTVTIADMLASRNSEVYGQIRNGMARFFSSQRSFTDANTDAFWHPPEDGRVLDECAEVLGRMTVGTVEDMPSFLHNLQRRLRVPYEIEIGVENFTIERGGDASLADIHALVEVNSIDLALFNVVMKRLPRASQRSVSLLGNEIDRRTLFAPQPEQHYSPPNIPGRQGFELYEYSDKLCWIGKAGRGRIHLAPSDVAQTLVISLYSIVPHYPLSEVVITLDGTPWRREFSQGDGNGHYRLAVIPPHVNVIELTIIQPYSLPASAITPGSLDRRQLGTALLGVRSRAA